MITNNFLGFKTPNKYAYQIPLYFRMLLLEQWQGYITSLWKPYTHWSESTVSTPDRLHNSSFFVSNPNFDYHLDFALFINNGGRTWKTNDSDTSATSVVSVDWDFAPPLWNVGIDTQYIGVIEEQKKTFRKNCLSLIVSPIEPCQQMQAGGRMYYEDWRRWVWPQWTR